MDYIDRIKSFDDIGVSVDEILPRSVRGTITLRSGQSVTDFKLIFSFSEDVELNENMAGMMLTMPVINFTYFSKSLKLNFEVSDEDIALISSFLKINAREVFINKICRRRYNFILPEYVPDEQEITSEMADGRTEIVADKVSDVKWHVKTSPASSIVLSSGGKESLLTYGMMNEIGGNVYAAFFNESGGHWRTAKTSYDFYLSNYQRVMKIWSNVDRFYHFVLKRLKILDQNEIKKIADTYPVQLFIFPVYVFSLIPFLLKYGIGNLLMGNEFDDPRDMPPYHGLKHYFGAFDQSNDFSAMISDYLEAKGLNSRLWSAVYPISGNLVEEILIKRYPDLYSVQRSCHSCRFENGRIVPCGKCTKCLGIMMFVLNAGGDPEAIGYSRADVENLESLISKARMRLDSDELSFLKEHLFMRVPVKDGLQHVRGLHVNPAERNPFELMPEIFRGGISKILSQYSDEIYELREDSWKKS